MLDLRESAARRDRMTALRLDRLVPGLMESAGVDCWILISREYAEDPVAQTMLPASWMSSRRRTILVFTSGEPGSHPERAAIARYEVGGLFSPAWDPSDQPDQWAALSEYVSRRNPDRIAVSTSHEFAHGDGLTHTEYERLLAALGPRFAGRVTSAEDLAARWLNTRIPEEKEILAEACSSAHAILRRALSPEAITPGTTTTADLEWWLRREVQLLGCPVWFHPAASVQRPGEDLRGSFAGATREVTIEKGDLVHIDFGLVWDHLCTDQQQHGYVMPDGSGGVPDGLVEAMASANLLQDILMAEIVEGRTGNQVLSTALARAADAGLDATIYTHPIGYHGHGAGPAIGLWDQQGGVPGAGDFVITSPSAWSIELSNRHPVPGWGEVSIMLEEEAWLEDGNAGFVDGRQTRIWEI